MPDKFSFKLNLQGVRELRRSPEMQQIINAAAADVAARAEQMSGGLPFEASVAENKDRAFATVRAGSIHARNKNRKENILEKALRSVKV